jgi:hypothetical protein
MKMNTIALICTILTKKEKVMCKLQQIRMTD